MNEPIHTRRSISASSSASSRNHGNEDNLAEAFVVCGPAFPPQVLDIPPGNVIVDKSVYSNYDPAMLWRFPSSHLMLDDTDTIIPFFSFPEGCTFSNSMIPPNFHTFVITTGERERLHGSALVFYEEVREMDGRYADLNKLGLFDGEKLVFSPKCICIISTFPFVTAHEIFLRQLHRIAMKSVNDDAGEDTYLPLECYIYNLISEVPLPPMGGKVMFTCIPSEPEIVVQRPMETALPIFDYSLQPLLEHLTIDVILELFECILLERKVIVRGRNAAALTNVLEALVSGLIYPFQWRHIYIPILPVQLLHMIEAPVPYIMGVLTPLLSSKCITGDIVFVDLDEGCVKMNEALPLLPHIEELRIGIVNAMQNSSDSSPSSFPTMDIRYAFLDFFVALFFDYSHHMIYPDIPTDQDLDDLMYDIEEVFDHQAFFSDQPENVDFFVCFLETQAFSGFIDNKIICELSKNDGRSREVQMNLAATSSWISVFDQRVDSLMQRTAYRRSPSLPTKYAIELSPAKSNLILMSPPVLCATKPHPITSIAENEEDENDSDKESCLMENLLGVFPYPDFSLFDRAPRCNENRSKLRHSSVDLRLSRFCAISDNSKTPTPIRTGPPAMLNVLAEPKRRRRSSEAPRPSSQIRRRRLSEVLLQGPSLIALSKDSKDPEKPESYSLNGETPDLSVAHASFVDTLLDEIVQITHKLIELRTSGSHNMDLSTSPILNRNVKAHVVPVTLHPFVDALVTKLCDVMESIWNHGVIAGKGKGALWSIIEKVPPSTTYEDSSFVLDRCRIASIERLRTNMGRSRAWIRLLIEKHELANHISVLLTSNDFSELYNPYSFLNCPAAVEKMVSCLKSLNTVEIMCFTNKNYLLDSSKYRIAIHTADIFASGTSACVSICLNGSNGNSDIFKLVEKDAFQRGKVDVFFVEASNVGPLEKITIGHDNSGFHPGWYLGSVSVENIATGRKFYFPCDRWLAWDEGDGYTMRELLVQTPPSTSLQEPSKISRSQTDISTKSMQSPTPSLSGLLPVGDLAPSLADINIHSQLSIRSSMASDVSWNDLLGFFGGSGNRSSDASSMRSNKKDSSTSNDYIRKRCSQGSSIISTTDDRLRSLMKRLYKLNRHGISNISAEDTYLLESLQIPVWLREHQLSEYNYMMRSYSRMKNVRDMYRESRLASVRSSTLIFKTEKYLNEAENFMFASEALFKHFGNKDQEQAKLLGNSAHNNDIAFLVKVKFCGALIQLLEAGTKDPLSFFGIRLVLWDYLLKIKEPPCLDLNKIASSLDLDTHEFKELRFEMKAEREFFKTITNIKTVSGKTKRAYACSFLCRGINLRMLEIWVTLMAKNPIVYKNFKADSFLVNEQLYATLQLHLNRLRLMRIKIQ